MTIIGLTGIIGAGKSLVTRILASSQIPVYDSDARAKKLNDTNITIITQLKSLLGEDIYDSSGLLRREEFASIIFQNPEILKQCNEIIHPEVKKDFLQWLDTHHSQPLVVKESALLFESGADKDVDTTVLVDAPESLCIARVMKRDRCSEATVRARMRNQWSRKQKLSLAQHVLNNDECHSLLLQCDELLRQLHF